MPNIVLSKEDFAVVCAVLAERVNKIDFDLGDCNNEAVRNELRADREVLIRALGEIALGCMQ